MMTIDPTTGLVVIDPPTVLLEGYDATHATATETKTFRDAHNDSPNGFTYLWFTSVGSSTGLEFIHDTETDDDDAYCNLPELVYFDKFADLTGTVSESGRWEWDGQGKPTDSRGNSILRIIAD